MEIQLIRHATMIINIKGQRFLLDPMLSPAGTMAAVPSVPNTADNPLVELPFEGASLLGSSAVLLTHTHRDHFDETAMKLLPRDIPLFCQPEDREKVSAAGFTRVLPVETSSTWQGITIHRTGGQHGTGDIGKSMGPVSGYVLATEAEPTLYITGDTIWCEPVQAAAQQYQPDVIICFAGAARFSIGDPITMDKEDVAQLSRLAPGARIVAVHMESWNHCGLSRQELKEYILQQGLSQQVYVPDDGESIIF